MSELAKFKDFNFKLIVVNKLMYQQKMLEPCFEIREFVENYKARRIDIEDEGYDAIPEVREYFESLDIPMNYLLDIEELYQDGGNDIYMQICPLWDGENDQFDVHSADDAILLPILKSITLIYTANDNLLREFESKGVKAKWL